MAPRELKPGDKAPNFTLPTDAGGKVSVPQLKGKSVVLYFYPKDDTSGCTAEAIAFSKDFKAFKAQGAVVVGVSKDSPASHDKFKAKHELALILAADEETKTAQAYGVWVEKSMYGRKYMGIERTTFVVDPQGKIATIFPKVSVTGHVEAVLESIAG